MSLGEGTEDTRRRASRAELGTDPATEAVVTRYGEVRLLSFDHDPASREPTVEVAHEALIRQWPRLRTWLDTDRDDLRLHAHLRDAAREWDTAGRPEGELYRGGRLEATEDWLDRHPTDPTPTEQGFIERSVTARQAQRDRERRANRRLRRLLSAVGVVAIVALVAGAVAFAQRREAADQRDRAGQAAAVAQTERDAAQTARSDAETRRMIADAGELVDTDPQLALQVAAEAHNRVGDDRSLGGLQQALTNAGRFLGFLTTEPGFDSLAFGEDGSLLAAAGADLWLFEPDGTPVRRGSGGDEDATLLLPEAGLFVT